MSLLRPSQNRRLRSFSLISLFLLVLICALEGCSIAPTPISGNTAAGKTPTSGGTTGTSGGSGGNGGTTYSPPLLEIVASATSVVRGESISLNALSGSEEVSCNWEVRDAGDAIVNTSQAPTTTFTTTIPNTDKVVIKATSSGSPAVTAEAHIDVIMPHPKPGIISFVFDLPQDGRTSAGVYTDTGAMVTTLWSNRLTLAGPQVGSWDGHLADGTAADPNARYQVRVLYSNVRYAWDVIGDTSRSFNGPSNWDLQASFPTDMAVARGRGFVASAYAERRYNAASFSLADPQSPTGLFQIDTKVLLQLATADDDRVYFANVLSPSFVLAYDISTSGIYTFPYGKQITYPTQNLKGALSLDSISPNAIPTGIAVQRNGPLLAIAIGASNTILLYDKKSGRLLRTLDTPAPQRMTFDSEGSLWVISGSSVYKIRDGMANTPAPPFITDLDHPLAITTDVASGDLLLATGGHQQQVLRFDPSGSLLRSYGKEGGYTDCDATVTNDRLFLDNTAGAGAKNNGAPSTWLASLPDGTFWVGESANARALHFSSAGDYLGQFSFMRFLYYVTADHQDPSRVFGDFLEFHVNYASAYASAITDENGYNPRWHLAKNWSVCLPDSYYPKMMRVVTMPDHRTFAEILNAALAAGGLPGLGELVELPPIGSARPTGVSLQTVQANRVLDDVGNLAYWSKKILTNGKSQWEAYLEPITKLGSSPQWGSPKILGVVDANATWGGAIGPIGFAGWGGAEVPKLSDGGVLVSYQTAPNEIGAMHLGGINPTTSSLAWATSPERDIKIPDGAGSFPTQASYGGHNGITAMVEGHNIIQGYDGQYGTFSSQWMHYWDDGLMIGQFGTPSNALNSDGTIPSGAAGNIATMSTVQISGEVVMYNSDESVHPGIHQWRLSNLDSIHEIAGTAKLGEGLYLVTQLF